MHVSFFERSWELVISLRVRGQGLESHEFYLDETRSGPYPRKTRGVTEDPIGDTSFWVTQVWLFGHLAEARLGPWKGLKAVR
jgi:hypothetical protein